MNRTNDGSSMLCLVGLTVIGSLALALAIGNGHTGGYWGVVALCATWVYLFTHKIPLRGSEQNQK